MDLDNLDLTDLAMVTKLWKTLELNKIGILLLKPWIIRREGRAILELQKDAKLRLAQTEKEVEGIKNGNLILDENYRLSPVGPMNTSNVDLSSLSEKVLINEIPKLLSKEINISKAILHAEEALINDRGIPSEQQIDKDWLNQWSEYTGLISTEILQALWGRILAAEVKSPGQYSLRTLTFLKNLSKKEAELISKLAPFVIDDFVVRNMACVTEQLSLGSLLNLQELGILQSVEAIGMESIISSDYTDRFECFLISGKTLLIIKSPNSAQVLKLPVYVVTSLGREIVSIIDANIDKVYLHQVSQYISKQGFKVEVALSWYKDTDGEIHLETKQFEAKQEA